MYIGSGLGSSSEGDGLGGTFLTKGECLNGSYNGSKLSVEDLNGGSLGPESVDIRGSSYSCDLSTPLSSIFWSGSLGSVPSDTNLLRWSSSSALY